MSKYTPWFPGRAKPVREGVYQRRLNLRSRRGAPDITYSLWRNGEWWFSEVSPHAAARVRTHSSYQDAPWRGLAEDPAKKGGAR